MSDKSHYIFSIDALKPDTLSMKSLSKYLADLSELIGEDTAVHFDRVQPGSAELVWWPEPHVEHRIRSRLSNVHDYLNHSDIQEAVLKLNKRLANDNSSAVMLTSDKKQIASFPGRKFKSFKDVPAFTQEDSLQGILIRIGGKDESIHAQLDMGGEIISKISLKRELARDLVKHFLGPTVRLNGKARWKRDYLGEWKLLSFYVNSFEVLDQTDLTETIDKLGSYLSDGIGSSDIYDENGGSLTDDSV